MKRLVIPDIHTKWVKAQSIIDFVQPDKTYFLGDYFDDWKDTPEANRDTALWMADRMESHPEDEWLLGNHDMQYVWHIEQCSGYNPMKQVAIEFTGNVPMFRDKLKLFTMADGWLLSHAGLTSKLIPHNRKDDVMNWLAEQAAKAYSNFKNKGSHWLVQAGSDRGGFNEHGGITWCDFRSFKPILGVKQLVGHTFSKEVRHKEFNYCIDTALEHYAIIEDGKLEIFNFEDEIVKGLQS